jgi:hypothetical protein
LDGLQAIIANDDDSTPFVSAYTVGSTIIITPPSSSDATAVAYRRSLPLLVQPSQTSISTKYFRIASGYSSNYNAIPLNVDVFDVTQLQITTNLNWTGTPTPFVHTPHARTHSIYLCSFFSPLSSIGSISVMTPTSGTGATQFIINANRTISM